MELILEINKYLHQLSDAIFKVTQSDTYSTLETYIKYNHDRESLKSYDKIINDIKAQVELTQLLKTLNKRTKNIETQLDTIKDYKNKLEQLNDVYSPILIKQLDLQFANLSCLQTTTDSDIVSVETLLLNFKSKFDKT